MMLSVAAGAAAWSGPLYHQSAMHWTGRLYTAVACSRLGPAALPARTVRPRRPVTARIATLAFFILAAISAPLLLATCSAPGQEHPPETGDALHPAASGPSPEAAAQVIAAYAGYFPALEAAEPQPREAAALARYAAQPYLGHVLAQMAAYRSHGEIAWGYLIPHVTSVQINGSEAIVRDCQDASNAWLVSSATGRVIRGTTGSARTFLIAALACGSDGRWRLTLLAHAARSCSRVPSPS